MVPLGRSVILRKTVTSLPFSEFLQKMKLKPSSSFAIQTSGLLKSVTTGLVKFQFLMMCLWLFQLRLKPSRLHTTFVVHSSVGEGQSSEIH